MSVAKQSDIPVCIVGGVRGQDAIEKILSETPIQYVAMARPFTANADYIKDWI